MVGSKECMSAKVCHFFRPQAQSLAYVLPDLISSGFTRSPRPRKRNNGEAFGKLFEGLSCVTKNHFTNSILNIRFVKNVVDWLK